jgi:c-di-AMP phosphodiesterase-like protein
MGFNMSFKKEESMNYVLVVLICLAIIIIVLMTNPDWIGGVIIIFLAALSICIASVLILVTNVKTETKIHCKNLYEIYGDQTSTIKCRDKKSKQ